MIPLWPLKSSYLYEIIDDPATSRKLKRQAQRELDDRTEPIAEDIDT